MQSRIKSILNRSPRAAAAGLAMVFSAGAASAPARAFTPLDDSKAPVDIVDISQTAAGRETARSAASASGEASVPALTAAAPAPTPFLAPWQGAAFFSGALFALWRLLQTRRSARFASNGSIEDGAMVAASSTDNGEGGPTAQFSGSGGGGFWTKFTSRSAWRRFTADGGTLSAAMLAGFALIGFAAIGAFDSQIVLMILGAAAALISAWFIALFSMRARILKARRDPFDHKSR